MDVKLIRISGHQMLKKKYNDYLLFFGNLYFLYYIIRSNTNMGDLNSDQTTQKYTNLVLEGGGVLGVAYCGALRSLHEKGILKNISNFAASSVGSIIAGALACGATFNFLEFELNNLNFSDLLDCSTSKIKNAYDLYYYYGICEGQKLIDWYGAILYKLTGNSEITLKEVHERFGGRLVVTGTVIGKHRRTVLFDYKSYPDMKLKIAIRISSSLPIIFKPYLFENEYYVDGGLLENYPIKAFHTITDGESFVNENTIGLMLMQTTEITDEYQEITDLKTFLQSIIGTLLNPPQKQQMEPSDWDRTIKINVGNVSSINFRIDERDKKFLFERGQEAVIKYFV